MTQLEICFDKVYFIPLWYVFEFTNYENFCVQTGLFEPRIILNSFRELHHVYYFGDHHNLHGQKSIKINFSSLLSVSNEIMSKNIVDENFCKKFRIKILLVNSIILLNV